MKLSDIEQSLAVKKLTTALEAQERAVTAGIVSDLLSDVLARGVEGGLLVTVQVHMNVVAVAAHAGLAAVIFAAGRIPEQSVVDRAAQEGILLFVSQEPAWQIVGRLYELGLRGPAA